MAGFQRSGISFVWDLYFFSVSVFAPLANHQRSGLRVNRGVHNHARLVAKSSSRISVSCGTFAASGYVLAYSSATMLKETCGLPFQDN